MQRNMSMFIILRSNNYRVAKHFADELKKTLDPVLLEAINDSDSSEIQYSVSINEEDKDKARDIIEKITKEMSKEFKIINRKGDDWDNNSLSDGKIDVKSGMSSLKSMFMRVFRESGFFTVAVLLICVLLFVLGLLEFNETLMSSFMMFGFSLSSPETWYKLITPALLHGGVMHIAFNLVMWIYIGGKVERYLSSIHLGLIFLLGTIIPNYAQYVFYGPNFVGLSGVIYALIGYAWIVSISSSKTYSPLMLPSGFMAISVVWILLGNLLPGTHMANGAHVGGLLIGLLLGLYELKFIKSKGKQNDTRN